MENCKNFYESQEEKDLQRLINENNQYKWFDGISGTPQYNHIDVVAQRGDKYYKIELKERDCPAYSAFTFNDVFIEPIKLCNLLYWQTKGYKSLYINYFGDDVVCWNTAHLDVPSLPYKKNVKIYDKGSKTYKHEDRYGLPKKQGKIINKRK